MTQPQTPELPDVVESSDDGDRPSITEVNGTVAKFEMAYSPNVADRFAFGPPMSQRWPSLLFLGFALFIAALVFVAYHGSSNTSLYRWVVEGDRGRVMGSGPLAFVICFAALGTVIRAALRGVVVTADAVEARYLIAGIPKVKRWRWAQIDRVLISDTEVMFELWNGSYERLPPVRDPKKMGDLLAGIATARGRQVTRLSAGAEH
ncbi:MAG: hypothetical protein KF819_27990 [Labilithrix sp.]|nr:hypothetical protein [Labilithrix sp.]